MINLRYHIVSIVAVFLALGIGLALGSTFVDGFIVSELETRVDALEESRNDARAALAEERDSLSIERAERAAQDVATIPLVGGGLLSDAPVMIIAVDGVDERAVQSVQAALLGSDARYEGTLWLTAQLDMTSAENRAELQEVLGLVDDNETLVRTALEIRLHAALFPEAPDPVGVVLGGTATEIAEELFASAGRELAVAAPTDTSRPASVLTQLRDAAIIRYDNEFAFTGALADVPVYGTRFVLVANADADLAADEIIIPMFEAVVKDGIDVVIVAVEPAPSDVNDDPVSFVGLIRDNTEFSRVIATVDDATSFSGTLSTLILLDTGHIEHLGSGPGASSVLPAV